MKKLLFILLIASSLLGCGSRSEVETTPSAELPSGYAPTVEVVNDQKMYASSQGGVK